MEKNKIYHQNQVTTYAVYSMKNMKALQDKTFATLLEQLHIEIDQEAISIFADPG